MWELDSKKGWALKNWCFWIVVLKKTLESLLDSTEIRLVNPKGNQPWIFIGRIDSEGKAQYLQSWLIGKDTVVGKDWRQEEKGTTEDEMVGWHYWPNGREFEETLGNSEGQGTQHAAVPGVAKSWTWLSDWTATTKLWIQCHLEFNYLDFKNKPKAVQTTLCRK